MSLKKTLATPAPSSALTSHFDSSARRDYIRFQICVWGFFWMLSLLSFIWDFSPAGTKQALTVLKTFETILMGFCSHMIWLAGRRYNWFRGPGRTRSRGLVACLIGATVVTLLSLPLAWILYRDGANSGMFTYGFPFLMVVNWVGVAVGLILWGGLYSAYYYQAQTRRLETERAQLLAATRESQLMALKGQINPHFLFNSLNTLRALIQSEPATAREAVTSIADMMRYSLTMSGHRVIPLAAELDFVNDYLALEHLRHEDRLRIRKSIAPETLSENIPPMLIQALVENAVKHGLRQRREGIEVSCDISLRTDDAAPGSHACMHVCVSNQGRLQAIPTTNMLPVENTGTGLRNIRERLRLIYGDRASLVVSQRGDFVVAEVAIPLVPSPENAPDAELSIS